MNYLFLASEEKLISILVLLDFSKAFDSMDHQLLCLKLSCHYMPVQVLPMRSNVMGLGRKSGIRDPASRIRCRTGISIKPTAFFIIHQQYHERYCIMSISPVCRRLYISSRPSDSVDCISSRLNLYLGHILQWSSRNCLSINVTHFRRHGGKSQTFTIR
jgi:hypothetical protein